jgi:hypothetical protein
LNVASAYSESSYLLVHHFAYHWCEGKVSVVRVYAYDLKHNRHFVLVATIADRNGVKYVSNISYGMDYGVLVAATD